MNTTFRAQGDLREANDGYRGEIYLSGDWRIIVCKDAIQLILQRRTRTASPAGARWEGIRYFPQARHRFATVAHPHGRGLCGVGGNPA
jgi:hypothetical protein